MNRSARTGAHTRWTLLFMPWLLVGCTDPVDGRLVADACRQSACTGSDARVTVWRDGSGDVALLVHDGSLTACSHPPTTYVSPTQGVRLVQANRPIESAEDAAAFEAEREQVTRGLVRDERSERCP